MARIRRLDTEIVCKIAAGEVIERPANVVKELLENSIDALATRIDVDVAQGGSERIRVVDNGEGIHPDDLPLTVASHATSKLQSADDLFRIRTMGFRGEALASIAAVSQFRIRSRTDGFETGLELRVEFGRVMPPTPCGCSRGTLVEVRQLFGNTPVRRKFLKTTATEFGHISEQFTRVALSHPRLHLTLTHNDRTVYELPPADRLIDRLGLFFGRELAEQLIWVESESDDIRMWGYVAHPDQSKATRKGQYFFLNGRWIQDRTLQHALTEAYRGLLMVGRQPIAFLFIEMPADLVDVNVHPTKSEVRFRDSQRLYRQLLSMIRTKFLSTELSSTLRMPAVAGEGDTTADVGSKGPPPHPTPPQTSRLTFQQIGQVEPVEAVEPVPQAEPAEPAELVEPTERPQPAGPVGAAKPRAMQVLDRYIIVEGDEGVVVIDQHALHERVLYEQLRKRILSGHVESQRLLVPRPVELSAQEAATLLDHEELLGQLGFGIQPFGTNTVLLNRYPAMLARADLDRLLRDLAEQIGRGGPKPTRRDLLDELLHMMACKAAIKAGQRLTSEEINSLLEQRHLIDDAHHCPHGRPTALVLSRAELDRQFGRMG
ncbi:MAG: DNA mismatch repair endonuclease MutL [Planctomycetes bacterium]|nr:DNA mismatch repair endonuclease MutL [Planctomycetota bacterium]